MAEQGIWDSFVDRTTFEEGVRDRNWQDLGDDFVELHYDALRWLNPVGFARVLPAYLSTLIRGHSQNELPDFVLSQLTRREGWEAKFDARLAELSDSQRSAIAFVLDELPKTERWSHYEAKFARASQSWRSGEGK